MLLDALCKRRHLGPTRVMDMFGHYPFLLLLFIAPFFRWGSPSLSVMSPSSYARLRRYGEHMTQAWSTVAHSWWEWVRDVLMASAESKRILCGTLAGTFGKEAVSSSARVAKLIDWKSGTSDSHILQILRSISLYLRKSQCRRKQIKEIEQVSNAWRSNWVLAPSVPEPVHTPALVSFVTQHIIIIVVVVI